MRSSRRPTADVLELASGVTLVDVMVSPIPEQQFLQGLFRRQWNYRNMPFVGRLNDNLVIPEEVTDGVTVECLECDGELYPRGPFSDGRARHFVHQDQHVDCSSQQSESQTHQKLKSLAVSALRQKFEGKYSQCGPEVNLGVSNTATLPDTRRADALIEFESENLYYGKGIIIEVQYKNHAKDKFATTHDYLSLGFSVFWANPSDFEADRLRFNVTENAFDDENNQKGIAVYNNDPKEFSTEISASLQWEDPNPDCSHSWEDMEECGQAYESCLSCGLNRMYDTRHTRFLYDNRELLGSSIEQQSSSSLCDSDGGHIWEPYGDGLLQCARCSARKVEGVRFSGEDLTLSMEYMGSDLSELSGDPRACNHNWRQRGREYQCSNCGLIEAAPY